MQATRGEEAAAMGRFGYVSAYDPARHMARVMFPDKGELVSAWLPVAVPNTKKDGDERPLDVGEHVYCNMLGNGLEVGIVLGAFWDDKNKPKRGDKDVRQVTFDDGAVVSYDRKEHRLTVQLPPDPEAVVEIAAPKIVLRGEVVRERYEEAP